MSYPTGSTPEGSGEFYTDSLNLAAFLHARGFVARVCASGTRCSFAFPMNAELDACIRAFERDQALISPRTLDSARARLRREMRRVTDAERREASDAHERTRPEVRQ